MSIRITNASVFEEDGNFTKRDIWIEGEYIVDGVSHPDQTLDAAGMLLLPGFIDIHIHGCNGRDFTDGQDGALPVMGKALAQKGITSFCPTSISLKEPALTKAFIRFQNYKRHLPFGCARPLGVNMEGPFLNPLKHGAHDTGNLKTPDFEMFKRLNQASCNSIAVACIAPELDGALSFIAETSKLCTVSLAHTAATYEQAKAGYEHGASHVTHLFNAMVPLTHRDSGVIGASFDYAKHAELIADGVHISPPVIRMMFQAFGEDRIVLISDAMSALFMEDGSYQLGGLSVTVKHSIATLADGTIAGSVASVADCVRRSTSFGIPMKSVLKAATINPAKAIGKENIVGSIRAGKYADLQLWDREMNLRKVMLGGQWL